MEKEDGGSLRSDLTTPMTWFGRISVKHALIVLNAIILVIAAVGTTLVAVYMSQQRTSGPLTTSRRRLLNSPSLVGVMQIEDLLTSASSLTLWSTTIGITVFGCVLHVCRLGRF